ncbi:hypothetical protein WMF38_44175 [Sorangium sp. So ce118]
MRSKISRRTMFWALSGCALVGGVCVTQLRPPVAVDVVRGSAASSPRARQGTGAEAALRCDLEPGERMAFAIRTSSSYGLSAPQVAGPGGSGDASRNGHALEGALSLRVLDAAPAVGAGRPTVTLAAVLEHPAASVGGLPDPALASSFAEPVLVRMDDACRITALAAPPSMPVSARNQWRMLLKMVEFVVPAPGAARSWTLDQSDALGTFSATYRRASEPGGAQKIVRKRNAYSALHQNIDQKMSANVLRTDATARWIPGAHWIHDAHIDEHIVLKMNGAVLADVRTTVEVEFRDVADAKGTFWSRDFDPMRYHFQPADRLEQDVVRLPYAERPPIEGLGGRPFNDVLRDVGALLARQPQADFDGSLNLLVQYLRLDPAHAGVLIDRIRAGELPDSTRSVLFLGLQLAGGKEAHDALASASRDRRLGDMDRARAASALAEVPDPDGTVVDALLALRDGSDRGPVVMSAALGLGTLASNARLDPESKQRIREHLEADLERAAGGEEIGTALAAIGNAGDASFRERVLGWTEDENPALAAEAYAALKKMDALPEPGALLDAFTGATDERLRSVLADALLGQRLGESEAERCIALLEGQPPASVRAVLLQLLGTAAPHNAAAKEALIRQLQVESDRALLTLIGRHVRPDDLL